MTVLGLDTSNYTTSAAVFDGTHGRNAGRLLQVKPGELGLRQSDALFQHVRQLPEQVARIMEDTTEPVAAVGASTRPRRVEGSYMPCFLAGESQGRTLARVLKVPFFSWSHQEGHLAAAAWSAGRMDLLQGPFLAWHLSGGTTELLRAVPEGSGFAAEKIGGTSDLSAGQLIDRTGVLLNLPFPAGKALDVLARESDEVKPFPVRLQGLTFSLSGMENKVKQKREAGERPAAIARFAIETLCGTVLRATREAQKQYPGLPVLCSGGVASNTRLREILGQTCGAVFAEPQYSTDNAMGVAILTWRALQAGEGGE